MRAEPEDARKRGQASTEMVVAAGIVMAIFILMVFFSHQIDKDREELDDRSMMENQCMSLSNLISGAYLSGPGSQSNMTLYYDIIFESRNSIHFLYRGKEVYCRSPVPFTNSSDNPEGTFFLGKGIITISNKWGSVIINNATLPG